eukprot:1278403-Pyramimonas_sp.AAC.1
MPWLRSPGAVAGDELLRRRRGQLPLLPFPARAWAGLEVQAVRFFGHLFWVRPPVSRFGNASVR